MAIDTVKLNDGNEIPAIAFGTGTFWKGKDVVSFVEQAIESGFSHIDTAQAYDTEEGVGAALRESGLERAEVYVTSKYGGGDIQDAVRTSLHKLGLKQLDLYLIHTPGFVGNEFERSWREFEKIKEDGLAKSIGVSNFSVSQLQKLIKTAKITPAVNQIRLHPYNYTESKPLLEYAAQHGIIIEAYSSLTPITRYPGGPVDEPVAKAAKRLGATPTQVILLWVRSKGAVIVTTTSKKEHLQEYLAVADLPPLTEEEVAAIDAAGAGGPPASGSSNWRSRLLAVPRRVILLQVIFSVLFTYYRLRWLS
ncbi:hypothetical protein HGRIS_006345 [Hohenbuehelia grisea]|uniref:NADP-dependent oxidoreductase domain-containing protein n=1 Tax=Hohenbuehelia grisea TaxID=104357 RepID=A0ABR3K0U8_9AGAR